MKPLLLPLSLFTAALTLLLRWILSPDYIRPHQRVERDIDAYLRELVTHSPTGKAE